MPIGIMPNQPGGPQLKLSFETLAPLTGFEWSPDGRRFAVAYGKAIHLMYEQGVSAGAPLLHAHAVQSLAWSPDGDRIASLSSDASLHSWNIMTGKRNWTNGPLPGGKGRPMERSSIAWSPSGRYLASICPNGPLIFWTADGQILARSISADESNGLAWISDEEIVTTGAQGGLWCWNLLHKGPEKLLATHSAGVNLAWSSKHRVLAVATTAGTVEILDPGKNRVRIVLEGHVRKVDGLSFSMDGRLLASRASDGVVQLWDCESWKRIFVFPELRNSLAHKHLVLGFNPKKPILATLGKKENGLSFWDVGGLGLWEEHVDTPLSSEQAADPKRTAQKKSTTFSFGAQTVHYANAKVVLVGDASVGKSGLGLVLTNQPFVPTLSTHGRNVWLFESTRVQLDKGRTETRETILWDLAGQPGYRLIHQLHLNEIAVALVVFDAQSEIDPLAGVRHWHRALRQAQRIQGNAAPPLKMFLIAARVDRGNVGISQERVDALVRNLGFNGYFKTSAKEGWQIPELINAIRGSIDWDLLPRVSSTQLFESIKAFLVAEKKAGRLLSSIDDLYRLFLSSEDALSDSPELRAQFEMCIGRVEWRGLIRRLSFGGLVLLQPELLDAYASALVNAAKDEPDGLGSIAEEVARSGSFPMPHDERVKDPTQEKLLLIAVVEDLLYHEIALREHAEEGAYLTFPSQLTREMSDLQDLKGKAGVLKFEGPVLNIYATLIVRLSHSNWFLKKELWKNAATFTAKVGGTYGIALRELGEGQGEVVLFYDEAASPESRLQFEEYILAHLRRRALPDTLLRRRILACAKCRETFSDEQVSRRLKLGHKSIMCPVCETQASLVELVEQVPTSVLPRLEEMDKGADERRDMETASVVIEGKIETQDYDVFLSYNRADAEVVLSIAKRLKEKGLLPWVDVWNTPPGASWQKSLEKQLKKIKATAVFVGKNGVGPWQNKEIEVVLQQFVNKKGRTVIPVLLENARKKPRLPLFLKTLEWVDFRHDDPDPLKQLIWGITGERSG